MAKVQTSAGDAAIRPFQFEASRRPTSTTCARGSPPTRWPERGNRRR